MLWQLTFGDPTRQKHEHNSTTKHTFCMPAGILMKENGRVHSGIIPLEYVLQIARKDARSQHAGWTLLEAKLVTEEEAAVKWEIPYPIARLTFDPTKTKKPGLRRVWADPLARTIWIVVKATHLTDQYFEKHCLAAAKEIRRVRPTTVEDLQKAMRMNIWGNTLTSNESFWQQFLPCVLGTRQIGYEVVIKKNEAIAA